MILHFKKQLALKTILDGIGDQYNKFNLDFNLHVRGERKDRINSILSTSGYFLIVFSSKHARPQRNSRKCWGHRARLKIIFVSLVHRRRDSFHQQLGVKRFTRWFQYFSASLQWCVLQKDAAEKSVCVRSASFRSNCS